MCAQTSVQKCGMCACICGCRTAFHSGGWLVSISHHTELLLLHNTSVRHLSVNLSRTRPCSCKYSQLQEHSSDLYISCGSNLVWYIFLAGTPLSLSSLITATMQEGAEQINHTAHISTLRLQAPHSYHISYCYQHSHSIHINCNQRVLKAQQIQQCVQMFVIIPKYFHDRSQYCT